MGHEKRPQKDAINVRFVQLKKNVMKDTMFIRATKQMRQNVYSSSKLRNG